MPASPVSPFSSSRLGEGAARESDTTAQYKPRNFLSKLTFYWAASLHDELAKRKFAVHELWQLPDFLTSKAAASRLQAEWDTERKTAEKPSLLRAMLRSQRRGITFTFLWMGGWLVSSCLTNALFLYNILMVLQRFALGEEPVVYIAGSSYPVPWRGLPWAAAFALGECGRTLSVNQQWWQALLAGMEVRAAVAELVYSKASRMRRIGADTRMTNLVTADAQRLCEMFHYGSFLISTPVTLVVVVIIGIFVLSISFLAGLALLVLSVPVQSVIVDKGKGLRKMAVEITDSRLRVMREILLAIKLIKLCAWEPSFADKVHEIRLEEIEQIARAGDLKAANQAFSLVLPTLVILVSFTVHTLGLGFTLSPASAFTVIALLNVARFPLSIWPNSLRLVSEGMVACHRLQTLLESDELLPNESPQAFPLGEDQTGHGRFALEVKDAAFSWSDDASASLFVPDLCVPKGTLCAVLGRTASGKSSLLAGALLGEMRRIQGTCMVAKPVGYVGQTPFLFNDTLKNNICFDQHFDKDRFDSVLRMTGLVRDVASFPDSIETELGERGINTSGGQRARIALARALYSQCRLLILDDPLSAVDQELRLVLFDAIKEAVRGQGRTVLIATHAADDLLTEVDSIALVAKGSVARPRTLEEIKKEMSIDDFAEAPAAESEGRSGAAGGKEDFGPTGGGRGRLVNKDETVQVGRRTVFTLGLKAGWRVVPAFVLLLVSEGSVSIVGGLWIAFWTRNTFHETQGFYAGVLLAIAVLIFTSSLFRGVAWSNLFLRGAASRLHDEAFRALMRAKLSLFDTTSMGNLLNRFSTDVDKLDSVLPELAETAISLLFRCAASIILCCVIYPWFLIMTPFLVLIYAFIVRRSRPALAQVKILDAASKSPLLSFVEATVGGLTSLRAWDAVEPARLQAQSLIDQSTRSHLAYHAVARLTALRLDTITTLISMILGILVVLLAHTTSAAFAGLALTAALQTSGLFQFGTRQLIETESQLSSVERIRWFIDTVPQEKDQPEASSSFALADKSWPSFGEISFENYSARYRPGLDLVLNDFSLKIPGGTSLGLVGRSGSGKSSTILALFRVLEVQSGRICVDGVDIASVPLARLRDAALSIVPQDPTLFRGTVRWNLDPWQQNTDEQLKQALVSVQLPDVELNRLVDEGGSNFSAGERQLVCFARALLKSSRIVCVDEGTSSVDNATSDAMNVLISSLFRGRTLVVVAHRLEAVLDLDLVAVMHHGKVSEIGPPRELASKPLGMFNKLYRQSSSSRRINV